MATYDYKGTKITGTSTTASKFPGSGVKNAHVGDKYLNKSTGHVYKCTEGGGSSSAKWKYTKTVVVKEPNTAVKSLGAPARSDPYVMKAGWSVPKKLTEKTNGRRASHIQATWTIGSLKKVDSGSSAKKESSLNLNNFTASNGKTYNRASFYPRAKRKLSAVSVTVVPTNDKGTGTSPVTASRSFGAPKKPSFANWVFDYENGGKISCKITTDAGKGYNERYDTRYIMTITDTLQNKTWNQHNTNSTATEITPYYDVSNYQQLSYDDYVKVTLKAWARGFAGDSDTVSTTYYVSYPKDATIKNVDVSSTDQTGKCTVFISTNNTTQHPVDQVRLEYLANCEYSDASLIPGDAAWTSSDIVDNAACTALTIPVTNLIPDRGKYTWVRVKSWHAAEAVLHRYSAPWRVTQLETPAATAADDDITILDTEAGTDGESVIVHLGWNKDGTDDSTGTELSWSDAEDAWRSTDEPDTYEFTWSDGSVTVDNVTYHDSATITIKGLEESTVYYIKARRYLEGDETTYSDYSNPVTQLTSETPDSVVASCASYVPSDGSLAVSWTFSSDSLQTAWQIVDTNGTVIADGQSSLGATQISAERIAQFATNNSLTFTVQVSTGSGYVVSEEHTVTIVDPPTLEVTDTSLIEETVEINPRTFTGDLVSFTTEAEEIATQLTIPLTPIQDLHGYDSPWVGGAGKNKLPCPYFTSDGTISGVTFTTQSDGSVVANGTATALITFVLVSNSNLYGNGSYILNGCPSGGGASTYSIRAYLTGDSADDYGSGVSITVTDSVKINSIRLLIRSGAVLNNVKFYPMIRLASETDATYAPYSNECPISGWDEVNVWNTGKNLVFKTISNANINAVGSIIENNEFTMHVAPVKAGQSYKVTTNGGQFFGGFFESEPESGSQTYDSQRVVVSSANVIVAPITGYVAFRSDASFTETQFEFGTTATTYEPYNGTTYPVNLSDTAGTVYGGTLDVVSGELTVTDANIASYNGETLPSTWISDRDVYASGTTPTIGAQVVYKLATPQTYQLTPTQIMTLIGDNNVWSDAGSLTLKIAEGYGTQLTLQDMPMTVTVQTNAPCDLTQIISAQGAVGQFPEGVRRQTLNDTVYSDVLSPEWTESNGVFSTTLSYPAGLDFWNLAGYTYTLTATDQVTGLQSEQVSFPFVVDWTNPAVSPVLITYTATSDTAVNDEETYYEKVGDNYLEVDPVGTENPAALGWYTQTITAFVTLTPQDYTDDDGFHHQSVEIALTPPTGSTSTDLYDIYRLTGDGAYLIGEGFPLTFTTTDEYAPFGDNLTHHYRFAIRTVEGDVAFADIEYTADGSVMRFDWAGGSLELPYNISIGDSYSKDVEIREHLNGTNDAYWRKNITRKGSLSSDVIRLDQQDEIMSARALAHYAGAVFVRTPDGSAYEADVQVSDLSTDGGPLTQIAVDATEIGLTQEFQLPIPTSGA